LVAGSQFVFEITRDGTHAVTWDTAYTFPDGVTPTGNNTNAKVDVWSGACLNGTNIRAVYVGSY
jgi:hypothetical protein